MGRGFFLLSSFEPKDKIVFSGYSFYKDNLIFQQEGLESFIKDLGAPDILLMGDGRFSYAQQTKKNILARTDDFGQDFIFYYCDGSNWAVSNSFYNLASFLSKQSIKLTIDDEIMRLGRMKHSMFQCLFTNDTYLREIKLLPLDKILSIRTSHDEQFIVELKTCNDTNKFYDNSNRDMAVFELSNYLRKSVRKVITMTTAFDKVICDVTGGNDSRIVLSLLLNTGSEMQNIRVASNKSIEKDYQVANILGENFNFKINNKGYYFRHINSEKAYSLWKQGNLGKYIPFSLPTREDHVPYVRFHGAGGGNIRNPYIHDFKKFVRNIYLNQSKKGFEVDDFFSLNRRLAKTFEELNIDMYHPQALMFHYRNFRSRFHFGRNTFRSFNGFLFTPLLSTELNRLSGYYLGKPFNQIYYDILSLTKKELLNFNFDTDKKNFNELNKSLNKGIEYSGNKLCYEPYKVYGKTIFEVKNLNFISNDEDEIKDILISELDKYGDNVINSDIYSEYFVDTLRESLKERLTSSNKRDFSHLISIGETIALTKKNC